MGNTSSSSSSVPFKLVGARIQYYTGHVSSSTSRDTQGGARSQQVMVGTWLLPTLRLVPSRAEKQEQEEEEDKVIVEEGEVDREVHGEWGPGRVEEAGVFLKIGRGSACFHLTDVETCLIQCTLLSQADEVLASQADEVLATQTFRIFLRNWPWYHAPLNRSLQLPLVDIQH